MALIKLKLPPRIKVLEALSSIADGRVELKNSKARVISSDGTREYKVVINCEEHRVFSSDNGTIYRKYIGYPIIAVLMLKGILPYSKEVSEKLKGIKWRELNEKYKSYKVVESIVRRIYVERGGSENELDEIIFKVMNKLSKMTLYFDENLSKE